MAWRKPGRGGCKPGLLSGLALIRKAAGFKQGRSPPTAAGPSKGKKRAGRDAKQTTPWGVCGRNGGKAPLGGSPRAYVAVPKRTFKAAMQLREIAACQLALARLDV